MGVKVRDGTWGGQVFQFQAEKIGHMFGDGREQITDENLKRPVSIMSAEEEEMDSKEGERIDASLEKKSIHLLFKAEDKCFRTHLLDCSEGSGK